jgi:hypothetical protein
VRPVLTTSGIIKGVIMDYLPPFCPNNCIYLSCNEEEQKELKKRNVYQNHFCFYLKTRVYHQTAYHPKLVKPFAICDFIQGFQK